MIVHNITTKVAWHATDQWLRWQKKVFFPKLLATGLCTDCRLFHLQDQDETEGPTYTAQLFFDNKKNYDVFLQEFYHDMEKETKTLWSAMTVDFSTAMLLVN